MKISHAFRADGRWDTWRQSRLRASQRAMYDDTLQQVEEYMAFKYPQTTNDKIEA